MPAFFRRIMALCLIAALLADPTIAQQGSAAVSSARLSPVASSLYSMQALNPLAGLFFNPLNAHVTIGVVASYFAFLSSPHSHETPRPQGPVFAAVVINIFALATNVMDRSPIAFFIGGILAIVGGILYTLFTMTRDRVSFTGRVGKNIHSILALATAVSGLCVALMNWTELQSILNKPLYRQSVAVLRDGMPDPDVIYFVVALFLSLGVEISTIGFGFAATLWREGWSIDELPERGRQPYVRRYAVFAGALLGVVGFLLGLFGMTALIPMPLWEAVGRLVATIAGLLTVAILLRQPRFPTITPRWLRWLTAAGITLGLVYMWLGLWSFLLAQGDRHGPSLTQAAVLLPIGALRVWRRDKRTNSETSPIFFRAA
jgi:hypothetical protein